MMDCVGMKYSVHKVEFQNDNGIVKGIFTQYPLWLFENTQKRLRILDREGQLTDGRELDPDEWLIACGDGLMFASSIAYLFKQLPLKDWLIYCERNGMPGIKAKTDAFPGTPQWENVCEAVREFGAEFHAVFSEGTEMDAIDVSTRGELPYPALIERVDRMMSALWRGSDLSTLSADNAAGASLQAEESEILEDADCALVEETLASYLSLPALEWKFGIGVKPAAYLQLTRKNRKDKLNQIAVYKGAAELGCAVAKRDVYEALELREPEPGEDMVELSVQQPAAVGAEAQGAGLDAFGNSSEPSEEDLGKMLDALATAKGKDIEPLRKRVLALEKITDPEDYADALEKLNADILALIGGENEAAEMEKILKKEAANV